MLLVALLEPGAVYFWRVLVVVATSGAALGAALSAGDAASRRSMHPALTRFASGALAPILAFAAGVSAETFVKGRPGWQTYITNDAIQAAAVASPLVLAFGLGAILAGMPSPGLTWEECFSRATRVVLLPVFFLFFLVIMLPGEATSLLMILVAAVLLATSVHVIAHRLARPLYRRVKRVFEPEA
jgi:hypothetical protein